MFSVTNVYHDLSLMFEYCSLRLVNLSCPQLPPSIGSGFQGVVLMKFAIFALAATMLAAGAASASDKVTDVDFLKANRCKGLATTLTGVVDVNSLDSFIKAERGARAPYVMERAGEEFAKAKKEAKG